MKKKIFKSTLLISLFTFLCTMLIIMGVLYRYFENQIVKELKSEVTYISASIELLGEKYFENVDRSNRITWIDNEGNVLYDNRADKESMENHNDREEVIEAIRYGSGMAQRSSRTLSMKTIYYAEKLTDGSIVRVSTTQSTVLSLVLNMVQPICFVAIIMLVLGMILSEKLSEKIVKPINDMDLEKPDLEENYDELAPFVRKIARQNQVISEQMDTLKQKQKEFETITAHMTEGLIVIDSKTDVLSFNHAAEKLLDCAMNTSFSSVYAMNRSENFRKVVESALEGKGESCILEKEERYLQLLANPVLEKEKVAGAILIIIDVTESEQREKLRREFTSNVSHELKTPLTSIYGLSDLLQNNMVKQEDITQFGKNIHEEAGRLITLVNDILKISQLDEGNHQGKMEEVNLYEMLSDILSRLENMAKPKNIQLNLEGSSAKINGYYDIIREMLFNLCDNAIKYNKENGIVSVSIQEKDDAIRVQVKDTGIGFGESEKERIFERFYRVDKSHSKKIGGTGLGLAIVKHAAICCHAKIEVESQEGQGSSFTVIFSKTE